jgi:hypothetical protein
MPTLNIQYSFTLKDGDKEVFDLKLDGKTLILREPVTQNPPPWAHLEFQQCPHCPLTADIYRHGDRHDLDLEGLTKIYNDIEKLNAAIVGRLRAAGKEDSTVNALIHLNIFAKLLAPGLEESLNSLQHLIRPFLTTHKNCR